MIRLYGHVSDAGGTYLFEREDNPQLMARLCFCSSGFIRSTVFARRRRRPQLVTARLILVPGYAVPQPDSTYICMTYSSGMAISPKMQLQAGTLERYIVSETYAELLRLLGFQSWYRVVLTETRKAANRDD